jgi:hypothetical protein
MLGFPETRLREGTLQSSRNGRLLKIVARPVRRRVFVEELAIKT